MLRISWSQRGAVRRLAGRGVMGLLCGVLLSLVEPLVAGAASAPTHLAMILAPQGVDQGRHLIRAASVLTGAVTIAAAARVAATAGRIGSSARAATSASRSAASRGAASAKGSASSRDASSPSKSPSSSKAGSAGDRAEGGKEAPSSSRAASSDRTNADRTGSDRPTNDRAGSSESAGGKRARADSSTRGDSSGGSSKASNAAYQQIEVEHSTVTMEAERAGDRSITWKLPGTAAVDKMSADWPQRIGPVSPLAAAIVADASYLRAMFGSLSVVLPFVGLALGIVSAVTNAGAPVAAPVVLFTVILVLGLIDAWAGAAATAVVMLASLVTGTIFSLAMLPSAVLVAVLWLGIPIIVAKVRPFNREHPEEFHGWWVRGGDVIIGSALAGYLCYRLIETAAVTTGTTLPIGAHAATIGWIVFGVVAFRYCLAPLASFAYPSRMTKVVSDELPEQRSHHVKISVAIRALFASLIFAAFLGWNVIVLVMAALYVADVLLPDAFEGKELPGGLALLVPRDVAKIFLVSVVAVLISDLCGQVLTSTYWKVALSLVGVLFIAMVVDVFSAFEERPWAPSWLTRLAGAALVILTALQFSGNLVN